MEYMHKEILTNDNIPAKVVSQPCTCRLKILTKECYFHTLHVHKIKAFDCVMYILYRLATCTYARNTSRSPDHL